MGGCYSGSYSSCDTPKAKPKRVRNAVPQWKVSLKSFTQDQDEDKLISAYRGFFKNRKSGGFFVKLAEASGLKSVDEIPKEFSDTEYEVKIDVTPVCVGSRNASEPSILEYMDSFDYPAGAKARFLKDPVNHIAEGINNFYGDSLDERLVVIEKCGNLYLKEKGLVQELQTNVPFQDVVIKRTEVRYKASFDEVEKRVKEISEENGVVYRGKIRKEKGDFFVLDSLDGRIYSMSFTRAHLIKPQEKNESGTQRQLELEYAGYIPGFSGLEKDSEEQIVAGMVDLARYTLVMNNGASVNKDYRINLKVTSQRKYDFILGEGNKTGVTANLLLPLTSQAVLENAK